MCYRTEMYPPPHMTHMYPPPHRYSCMCYRTGIGTWMHHSYTKSSTSPDSSRSAPCLPLFRKEHIRNTLDTLLGRHRVCPCFLLTREGTGKGRGNEEEEEEIFLFHTYLLNSSTNVENSICVRACQREREGGGGGREREREGERGRERERGRQR